MAGRLYWRESFLFNLVPYGAFSKNQKHEDARPPPRAERMKTRGLRPARNSMETRGLRPARKRKRPPGFETKPGGLKERPAARCSPTLLGVVPSPRGPLTSVFGKGTGVTAPPRPPARKSATGCKGKKKEGSQKGRRGAPGRRVAQYSLMSSPPAAPRRGMAGGGAGKPHGLSEPVC